MDTVYERLAARLDELPNGFPRTASGVELRILEKIFTPAEAELALRLKPLPETVEAIAHRLRRPVEEVQATLEAMLARGQITTFRRRGRYRYLLAPFVVGIYEYQLPRMDAELAAMFEEYAGELVHSVGGSAPALARVVPVNVAIDAQAQVLPHESMRQMIEGARSFRLMECICRREKAALGQPCSHTLETCMAFSSQRNAYERFPTWGRVIDKDEALAVIAVAEREGLVHCTYNVSQEPMFVCNCCSCCCAFLRGVNEYHAPHLLVRSNWAASIDAGSCTECGDCAGGRCPMGAIAAADGGGFCVDAERCIGCGVCTVACPSESITLALRPRSQRTRPARNIVTWSLSRSLRRSGFLRTAAHLLSNP